MATNTFVSIPVPAGNGTGAPVSAVGLGLKTIIIGGVFEANVIIEGGVSGRFAPLARIDNPANFRNINVPIDQVRIRVTNFVSGTPIAFLGGEQAETNFAPLDVPLLGNGTGVPLDTSIFGEVKSVIVDGQFEATLTFEASEDVAGPFAPFAKIDKPDNVDVQSIISRFVRVVVTNHISGQALAGIGASNISAGGGGAFASNCLIHRPGSGLSGPVIFDDFNDLDTQLGVLRAQSNGGGCYQIQFDTSLTGFTTTLPLRSVGGPYNTTDVELIGTELGPTPGLVFNTVVVPEGVTFTRLRKITGNIQINNAATATIPCNDLVDGDIIILENANISTTGSVPFYSGAGLSPGDSVFVNFIRGAGLGQLGAGTVIDMPVAGAFTVQALDASLIRIDTIGGVGGAFLLNVISGGAEIDPIQTAFLGTRSETYIDTLYLRPSAILTAPVAGGLDTTPTQLFQFDVSGGAVAQTLRAALNRPGHSVLVREVSGTAGLTLVPAGADTINGVAGPFTIAGGASFWFVYDGVSDLRILTSSDPIIREIPPEVWTQNDVAAGQTAVDLETQVSQLFLTWKALRPGSIIGISTRLTEAVTAGSLLLIVTINGTPSATLGVISTSGSNPTGGQLTQAAGVDTYVAGDLLGIELTSSAGFLPITTDVEAYLEIQQS